jgi:hypothetical protein
MNLLRVMSLILMGLILIGCSQDDHKSIKELRETGRELEAQLNALEGKIKYLDSQISMLRLEKIMSDRSVISFTSSSEGFNRLDTDTGTFFVALKNIQEYANGYKVTFSVGNPDAATYDAVDLKVLFGRTYQNTESYVEWKKSLKESKSSLKKPLLPMTWNTIDVILAPADKADIAYIELSMAPKVIKLGNDFRDRKK